jgi:hypothetical protein
VAIREGLARGVVHEWFGVVGARADVGAPRWIPPLGVLLYLACRSLERSSGDASSNRRVAWIGKRCWPYPHVLGRADRHLLRRSIFIDPPDEGSRLWAIDLAARCPSLAAVVADGSGLDMAATRRLQLAAEAGSTLVLCTRPPRELDRLSAAAVRWLVRSAPSTDRTPRWIVELLRCKGLQPESEVLRAPGGSVARELGGFRGSGRRWTVEWKGAQGSVFVHAALLDRSGAAAGPDAKARRSA